MDESIPDFYLHSQSIYSSILQDNISLAYKGTVTAKQALDLTAIEWRRVTQRVGIKKQQKAWLELKNKYPSQLKKILR